MPANWASHLFASRGGRVGSCGVLVHDSGLTIRVGGSSQRLSPCDADTLGSAKGCQPFATSRHLHSIRQCSRRTAHLKTANRNAYRMPIQRIPSRGGASRDVSVNTHRFIDKRKNSRELKSAISRPQ
jgi:hypothetical protein